MRMGQAWRISEDGTYRSMAMEVYGSDGLGRASKWAGSSKIIICTGVWFVSLICNRLCSKKL